MPNKPPPRQCGNCPWLESKLRSDFHPATPEFRCKLRGAWIGFLVARPPEWCLPVIQPDLSTEARN